jgi:hypothetical protein
MLVRGQATGRLPLTEKQNKVTRISNCAGSGWGPYPLGSRAASATISMLSIHFRVGKTLKWIRLPKYAQSLLHPGFPSCVPGAIDLFKSSAHNLCV